MEEFFRELEDCLRGEVPGEEIRDSLQYYRQYFAEQKAAGYSEEEIIRSLGSPRLIARSIIDAREAEEERDAAGGGGQSDAYGSYGTQDGYYGGYESQGGFGGGENRSQDGYYDVEEGRYRDAGEERGNVRIKKISGLKLALVVILVLLVLGMVVRVLLPVALVLVPLFLIWRLLRGNR